MKREGWQHGMARTTAKMARHLESPPPITADHFHPKTLPKPTNASKFTGKCRKPRCAACRHHPVSKSKDKAKGALKLRSCDVALNYRLVSWRVIDEGRAPGYVGSSASAFLRDLISNSWHEEDEDEDDDGDKEVGSYFYGGYINGNSGAEADHGDGFNEAAEGREEVVEATDDEQPENGEEEDMEFYMVGVVWEFSDQEEDWLVVQEI